MNIAATIGHNNPPDPIDTITASFGDVITEAENWLDGSVVETEAQMKSVDTLIKGVKAARKAVDDARDATTKPLHEVWKGEIARWKPTQDDLDRIVKGLVGIVDGFKRRLAAEKAEADRKAQAAAWEATRKAQEAARAVDVGNIESTRAAAQAMADADAAQKAASSKDTVKGMRTVTKYALEDDRAALHWIAANDKPAIAEFIAEYVRRNHKNSTIAGVRVWKEQEAY